MLSLESIDIPVLRHYRCSLCKASCRLVESTALWQEAESVSRGWIIFIWCVIGGVLGQALGYAFANQVPFLVKAPSDLGFDPFRLDLSFLVLTLGFKIKLTIAGAIGLAVALWIALRSA
jgi:hypothetical protein